MICNWSAVLLGLFSSFWIGQSSRFFFSCSLRASKYAQLRIQHYGFEESGFDKTDPQPVSSTPFLLCLAPSGPSLTYKLHSFSFSFTASREGLFIHYWNTESNDTVESVMAWRVGEMSGRLIGLYDVLNVLVLAPFVLIYWFRTFGHMTEPILILIYTSVLDNS